jgi:hypothetical protein
MDSAVKILMATAVDQTKKHQGPYKREYQRIGHAFSALGLAFREDDSAGELGFCYFGHEMNSVSHWNVDKKRTYCT